MHSYRNIILLILVLAAGCTSGSNTAPKDPRGSALESDDRRKVDHDDEDEIDGEIDYEACDRFHSNVHEFVSTHRACGTDGDCAIVGDCSGGFGFRAVNREGAEAGQALSDATPIGCATFDGPIYTAVCENHECVAADAGWNCGQRGFGDACPAGFLRYVATGPDVDDGVPEDGCYHRCGDANPGACPQSMRCERRRSCGAGAEFYDEECELQETSLCMPEAECQVQLSLDFEGTRIGTFWWDEPVILSFWAENRSDAEVALELAPCALPEVEGVPGGYDFFEACFAECEETSPRAVTLEPGERIRLASSTLELGTTECNPEGMPGGKHLLTFAMSELRGATLCSPTPVELRAPNQSEE